MTDIRICKLLYDFLDSKFDNRTFEIDNIMFKIYRQKISFRIENVFFARYYIDSLDYFEVDNGKYISKYVEDYEKCEQELIEYLEENNLFEILSKEFEKQKKTIDDNHVMDYLTNVIDNFLSKNVEEMCFGDKYDYALIKKIPEGFSIKVCDKFNFDYEIIFKDSKTPIHATYYNGDNFDNQLIYDYDIDISNRKVLFNFYDELKSFLNNVDNKEIKIYKNNLKEFEEEMLSLNEEVCRQREELQKMRDFRNLVTIDD